MPKFSNYIVYVDESGDHSLQNVNPQYPVFVLAFCIFKIKDYTDIVTPKIQQFKFEHFGHDVVILHEREIRKREPPFEMLMNGEKRKDFMSGLNSIFVDSPMSIVAAAIDKQKLSVKTNASNLYNIAMRLGLERLHVLLEAEGQHDFETMVVFEARGKKEDAELELEFRRVCDGLNSLNLKLSFNCIIKSKLANSGGLQLADLIARPIGRKVINPAQENRAFEIIETKLAQDPDSKEKNWGLKLYP